MRPAWTGRRTGLGLALVLTATLLASCHRPGANNVAAAPTPIGVERAGPARWNATSGGFELNGKPVKTTKLWTFDGSTDGFTTVGSTILPAPGQGAAVTIADPTLRSPKGLSIPGGQYNLVLVRLTRVAQGAVWDGALYYSTPAHHEATAYFGKPLSGANPKVGETTTLVYDMAHQANGAPDWMQSSIDQIRLDLEDKPGGIFVIRQIAIGENPDPTTAPKAAAPAAKTAPPPAAKS
ncbi:hypothetical protein [Phenylobacterium sp.]|uniref:hypothetical protein n=1 Tax=Phenylobacterium sp. TaxID=1871053 RepID=UPI0011F51E8B|nr:hypothetical protein [Phenylobacterium sp.]THD62709.1 MAG: hypothetical protein E8A49_06910 [Phenylobacterium sp.]